MPPTPGPFGDGEETAANSSGCRKVTGRKQPLCVAGEWGQGDALPGLCALPSPAPPTPACLRKPHPGGLGGGLALCLAPSTQIVHSGPHWGRGQARGDESLSQQKAVLRPLPARTSIRAPQGCEETESAQPER